MVVNMPETQRNQKSYCTNQSMSNSIITTFYFITQKIVCVATFPQHAILWSVHAVSVLEPMDSWLRWAVLLMVSLFLHWSYWTVSRQQPSPQRWCRWSFNGLLTTTWRKIGHASRYVTRSLFSREVWDLIVSVTWSQKASKTSILFFHRRAPGHLSETSFSHWIISSWVIRPFSSHLHIMPLGRFLLLE